MIKSMTAFARQETRGDWGVLTWEIRSLNHRYLDVSTRLPEDLRALEGVVRERTGTRLARGKVECNLRFQRNPGVFTEIQLNQELASKIVQLAEQAGKLTDDSSAIRSMDILRWPGVVEEQEADMSPVNEAAITLLESTLDELVVTREKEGNRLAALIRPRCDRMDEIVVEVRKQLPRIRTQMKERLISRLAELELESDNNRLEQEMVIQAQKMDVDEELDRLNGHIREVRDVLERNEPIGRRLDFLMQELNREANTLGSKSTAVETTKASVELKVLIEQMREQIQNIE